MSVVIGVPRGLLFYEYGSLIVKCVEACGMTAVVSNSTDKSILEAGLELCVDDACLPVKAYFGHAAAISDRVDALLIPRFISVEAGAFICPKLMGLPDMVRARMPGAVRIIDPCIDLSRPGVGLGQVALELGRGLGVGTRLARTALRRAVEAQRRSDQQERTEMGAGNRHASHDLSIGVLGHRYAIDDPYISMNLMKKLSSLGAHAITAHSYPLREVQRWETTDRNRKRLFWTLGRRAMGACDRWHATREVDGIIHVMPFGCGPEAFTADMIRRAASQEPAMAFLLINIDEHSGEAGLSTRLEAFIDTVRMRKHADENHLSEPGQLVDTPEGALL